MDSCGDVISLGGILQIKSTFIVFGLIFRKTIDVPMDWLDDGEEMYKLFMEGKVPTDDDEEEEEEDEDHEISADVSPPAAAPVTVPEVGFPCLVGIYYFNMTYGCFPLP